MPDIWLFSGFGAAECASGRNDRLAERIGAVRGDGDIDYYRRRAWEVVRQSYRVPVQVARLSVARFLGSVLVRIRSAMAAESVARRRSNAFGSMVRVYPKHAQVSFIRVLVRHALHAVRGAGETGLFRINLIVWRPARDGDV